MKQKLQKFMQGRYGMDPLGNTLYIGAIIVYLVGCLFQSGLLSTLGLMVMIYQIYRMLSRQCMVRSEENRKYQVYQKLWKLRWQCRKEYKIFLCKSCGRYVRVPKGLGKIEVRCTVCGYREVHKV